MIVEIKNVDRFSPDKPADCGKLRIIPSPSAPDEEHLILKYTNEEGEKEFELHIPADEAKMFTDWLVSVDKRKALKYK